MELRNGYICQEPYMLYYVPASAKYLGVDMANDLSCDEYINRSTKKANQTLGFLHRNIKVNSGPLDVMAYKTLVRPQLEYASEVWYSTIKPKLIR